METQITVALIAAISSLGVAIFSLLTSRRAKVLVLRAEEQGKRTEQIRLKATESGEKLLKELSNLIIALQGIHWRIKRREKEHEIYPDDVNKAISKSILNTNHFIYETAIYTTPEIRQKIVYMVEILTDPDGDAFRVENIESTMDQLINIHTEVSELFKHTYLEGNFANYSK